MDVRAGHGAVEPDLAAGLDACGAGMHHQQVVDLSERLGAHPLDVALQGGMAGRCLEWADSAEAAKAPGVREVEGQVAIAEAVHLLEDEGSKDLLSRDSGSTCPWVLLPLGEVSEHEIENLRACVQDVADDDELAGVLMLAGRQMGWRKGELLL